MAVIPPDVGLRLRLQNDAAILQPTAPVQELPVDLPELRLGQTFMARIQEVLPENTYKALVAGKQITLQLPQGANAGDTLELVVVDRTPRMVIAHLAEQAPAAPAAGEPYKYATLSSAGQMISNLLLPEGETPQPAVLNRGEPLLPRPPAAAADLVPVLQKAVTQSGLFYESHQAQWVGGRLPLEQLLQEPQGRHSAPEILAAATTSVQHRAAASARGEAAGPEFVAPMASPASPAETNVVRSDRAVDNQTASQPGTSQQVTSPAQTVPDELRPIVQQQLDAVATQRLLWHGEAWPNQPLEWEIVQEEEHGAATAPDEEAATWRTTLRLDTPRLGHLDASLRLTAAGLHMTLATTDAASATDLQTAVPTLAASLAAAGVPLLSSRVSHESE